MLRNSDEYKAEMQQYGTGSALQQGIQAATAAVQGLAGGDVAKALAGGSAPYLATIIAQTTEEGTSRLMAHAVVNAVLAAAQGNNALAGAAGAVSGEVMAQLVMEALYPGKNASELSESEKQTISMLGTLAAGLAGGLIGDNNADTLTAAQAGKTAVENNYLSVSEKSELEIAKQKLRNSKDPEEREQAEKEIARLIELDISRDKKVIAACSNGAAGSVECAAARLDVYKVKAEYENTGNYNSRASQQYADAYGQIVNLLNITSVDAQNQQQVKDAMVNYAMQQLGVDKATAEQYVSTYDGMKIVAASVTPVLGSAAASKLEAIGKSSALQTNIGGKPITFDGEFYSVDGMKLSKSYYERLWTQGRPAPFIQAKEVLNSNPKIEKDPRGAPGYYRYEGVGLEMIYNPSTGQIGHIQPVRIK